MEPLVGQKVGNFFQKIQNEKRHGKKLSTDIRGRTLRYTKQTSLQRMHISRNELVEKLFPRWVHFLGGKKHKARNN
jgi:hypothetical protein